MRINITIITLIILWICTPYCNNLFLTIISCLLFLFYLTVKNISTNIINILPYKLIPIIYTIISYIYYLNTLKILKQKNYERFNCYLIANIRLFFTPKVSTKLKITIKYIIIAIPSLVFRSISITFLYLIGVQLILKYVKPEFLSYFLFKIYKKIINKDSVDNHTLTIAYLIYNIINSFFININLTRDGLYIRYYSNLNINNNLMIYHKIFMISFMRFYNHNIDIVYNLWNRCITYKNFKSFFMKYDLT